MHQHIERRAGLRDRQVRSPPSDFAIDTAQGRALAVVVPMLALGPGPVGIRRKNSMWGDESVTYQLAHRSVVIYTQRRARCPGTACGPRRPRAHRNHRRLAGRLTGTGPGPTS